MKKITIVLTMLILNILLIAGCASNTENIASTSPVENSSDSVDNSEKNYYDEVMLIQVVNNGFPQSQGIYDLQDGKLTIVKHYFVADSSNKDPEELSQQLDEEYVQIEKDFKENFPDQDLKKDPFKSYEREIPEGYAEFGKEKLTLYAEDFEKSFEYLNDKKSRVMDDNQVEYEIKAN